MAVVGGSVTKADMDSLLNTLNMAQTKYGVVGTTVSGVAIGSPVTSTQMSTVHSGLNAVITKSGAPVSTIDLPVYSTGNLITANLINLLTTKAAAVYNYCTCNCNYCSCDCARCSCDCARCSCDCARCSCDCNRCTCDCDKCCDYCTVSHDDDKFCLVPGQILHTNTGAKPIEDIMVGDYLISHAGEYQKVLLKWASDYNGDICGVFSEGNNEIWLTDEHGVYVDSNGEKKFIEAKNINAKQDRVLLPRISNNSFVDRENKVFLKDDLLYDDELLRFIGYFIATGRYVKEEDEIIKVVLDTGDSEITDDINQTVKQVLNVDTDIVDGDIIVVDIRGEKVTNLPMRYFFTSIFGEDVDTLPVWLYELSEDKIATLIDSIKWAKGGLIPPNERVAYQVKLMLAKLCHVSKVEGEKVVSSLADYDKEYIYIPVEKVETKHYVGKVFNLIVDKDNSYVSDIILKDVLY